VARDAGQVRGGSLKRVHADRAVYVHVDEARVEREPREVYLARAARVGPGPAFDDARDAAALDEEVRAFGHAVAQDDARVSQ
jgi:hypothetical protein